MNDNMHELINRLEDIAEPAFAQIINFIEEVDRLQEWMDKYESAVFGFGNKRKGPEYILSGALAGLYAIFLFLSL